MFKKHEIKFKAHTLYLENYIDIGNGLYKCGCGIIFSSLWNAKLFPECPRCKTENTLVKSIEDISALMIEYNLSSQTVLFTVWSQYFAALPIGAEAMHHELVFADLKEQKPKVSEDGRQLRKLMVEETNELSE